MQGQAVRRLERPVSRRIRDFGIIGSLVAILLLAMLGAFSGVAFLAGAGFGNGPSHGSSGNSKAILAAAQARAAAVMRTAEREGRTKKAKILRQAHAEGHQIVRRAQQRAARINRAHHGANGHKASTGGRPTATRPVVPPPVAAPTPAIPNFPGVPASWVIVAYGTDAYTGSVNLENRGSRAFSGIVTLRFYGRGGRLKGVRSGSFTNLPAQSVGTVSVGAPPPHWGRFRVSVSGIH